MVSGDTVRKMTRAEKRELFDTVCRELTGPLISRCQAVVENSSTAEDVAQDVLLKLHRELGKPRSLNGPLIPWLWRVAFNDSINQLKKQNTRRWLPIDDDLCCAKDGLDWMERDDLLAKMMHEVESLPEKQRTAFKAVVCDGRKPKEAAEWLGWSDASVRNNLSRAVQRIRSVMSGDRPDG